VFAPLGTVIAEIGRGDHVFGRIVDVALTGDGSVVVADGQTQEAAVFTVEGEALGTFSGQGQGPGEFRSLRRIIAGPDGTVHLAERRRAAEFSGRPVPQHVETSGFDAGTTVEGVEYAVPELVAVLRGDSDVLVASLRGVESPLPPHFGPAEVTSTSWRGLLISSGSGWRELSRFPPDGYIAQFEDGLRLMFDGGVPFDAEPSFSASDSSVLLSSGSDYTIRELDSSGTTIRGWTVCGLSPRQLTDAEIARFIDALVANDTDDARASSIRSMFESIDYPATHPAVGGLVFDRSQQIWIRLETLDQGDAEVWGAFTTDGDWLGTFEAPAGIEVQDIREGTAVGVRTDELGVQTAVVVRVDL